jgi:hypothetical protein
MEPYVSPAANSLSVVFPRMIAPRLPQPLDDEGVAGWAVVLEHQGAFGRGHAGGVDLVLHHDRNAVHRPDERARLLERGVQRVRLLEGAWVDRDDAVDRRPLLVVRVDAVQAALDQPMRGQRSRLVGGVHLID